MKWLAVPLLGLLGLFPAATQAKEPAHRHYEHNKGYRSGYRYPNSYWQHGSHYKHEHDAYRYRWDHDHKGHWYNYGGYGYRSYGYPNYGFGYLSPGFSIWLGR